MSTKDKEKHDHFLADAIKPPKARPTTRVGYLDGFRFGLGFFVANLLALVVLGGLTCAIIFALHLH